MIYYVRRLTASGVQRSEPSVSVASGRSAAETEPQDANWETYCEAYVFAGGLVRGGMGRKKAARETGNKFNISFSASSARNAGLSDGERPAKKAGRMVAIPQEVEKKLEDLCLLLRDMKLPVFRYMVLNYVNILIKDTEVAERFKDKEVKRCWYYRWLGRCTRLRTANLTPLEMTRAQWATSENAKKHYDMLVDILMKAGLAVLNEAFNPAEPRSERIIITKPWRVFSMDESRLTNDTTVKDKSKANRSLVSREGDSCEVLVNKGGGDGTGIGGSAADGMDLPGFFIFAKNLMHIEDVDGPVPTCRRPDPADPGEHLSSRCWGLSYLPHFLCSCCR